MESAQSSADPEEETTPRAAPSASAVSSEPGDDIGPVSEDAGNGSLDKGAEAAVALLTAEDTASASSGFNDGEIYDDDFDEDDDPMPLINYTRLTGSIPRMAPGEGGASSSSGGSTVGPLSDKCNCAALGKVILDPSTMAATVDTGGGSVSSGLDIMSIQRVSSSGGDGASAAGNNSGSGGGLDPQRPELFLSSDLWKQPHYVMALGLGTGEVSLINARTGISLMTEKLKVREGWSTGGTGLPIVDLSFDSSGTFLAAIDTEGTCAIWELKYAPSMIAPQQQDSSSLSQNTTTTVSAASQTTARTQPAAEGGMFSSFMSKLTGVPPTETTARDTNTGAGNNATAEAGRSAATSEQLSPPKKTPSLTATIVQVSRITYPKSFGTPTCLALDPAHKKRREKSLVAGFADGRLVLTRRGFFQRRTDSVLYQGAAKTDEKSYRGIEAIAWRGSLVAWADASGIKLLDADNLTRIAHIDRPTGARPTLYPTISSLRPSLLFETSTTLLVAWGDCLMTMTVREVQAAPVGSAMTGLDASGGQQGSAVKRRAVECTMAWELDCVACGVVPLDADNVVVLGLVPPLDDDDDDDEQLSEDAPNESSNRSGNDLEIQVVSRKDGAIMYSDSLPILRKTSSRQAQQGRTEAPGNMAEPAIAYNLLSSFALPRMEDAVEAEDEQISPDTDQDFDLNVPLFSTSEVGKRNFRDSHLDWALKSVMFDYDKKLLKERSADGEPNLDQTDDDSHSVDSDDYTFVTEPIPEPQLLDSASAAPPIMVVTSSSDIILSRMADVDDAISHALAKNKRGLALRRALHHKTQLRRYELSDLVSSYLQAVLRIPQKGLEAETKPCPLSIRRMTLAVQSMPALFGGNISLWERWTREMESVPGAVFLLRDHLPVRDPILPPTLYARVLQAMLKEAELLIASESDATTAEAATHANIVREAQDRFLSTLIAWGPTKILKEYIRLFKGIRERREDVSTLNEDDLRNCEILLQRRYLQTAAGYLSFPIRTATSPDTEPGRSLQRFETNKDDSRDSLFDPSALLESIAPSVASSSSGTEASVNLSSIPSASRMCLDAIARLKMMNGRYDLALQCFLAIGDLHSSLSLEELESAAIEEVNNPSSKSNDHKPILIEDASYEFVLGLVDFQTLHRFLLNKEFVRNSDSKFSAPLFALLRLVGLDLAGDFLINHCVSPEVESASEAAMAEDGFDDRVRRATLPIDKVAGQLEQSPKILHWYLHRVFTQKPDLYVKFPNTANPPKAVTDLHRRHFDLYVEFGERDTAKSLAGTEAYKIEAVTTPLLSFLEAALPLGGITPVNARRTFESYRSRRDNVDDDDDEDRVSSSIDRSHHFALELAFIIEHYSEGTEAEAKGILDLYLEGADSVVLAVAYAQRQRQHSAVLWEKLISYCLSTDVAKGRDGLLFGSLLEAAALSGADLARLVAKIPPGMVVEGLRPRLVAAVADYRLKLNIHEAAVTVATVDKNVLQREVTHRSRRGVRFQRSDLPDVKLKVLTELLRNKDSNDERNQSKSSSTTTEESNQTPLTPPTTLPKTLRTVERHNRYRTLSRSLPVR